MIRWDWALATLGACILASEAALLPLGRAYWRGGVNHELISAALLKDRVAGLAAPAAAKRLLVLGDSVMAGGALREKGDPAWRTATPPAVMRGWLKARGWEVLDFSADGLYPSDLEALYAAAAGLGCGQVVLELNYRMLCPAAGEPATAFALPWLSGAEPRGLDDFFPVFLRPRSRLFRYSELARHRLFLSTPEAQAFAAVRPLFPSEPPEDEDSLDALLDLKLRPYYVAPRMPKGHAGLLALGRLFRALKASGAQVLVFLTPQNYGRVSGYSDEAAMRGNRRLLKQAAQSAGVRYLDWSERKVEGEFLDHCHLDAGGNRALAGWILEELGHAGI